VQLLALGVSLRQAGFAIWDLGMPMRYKSELGAAELDRTTFLERYRSHRDERPGPLLDADAHALLKSERLLEQRSTT
jgi:hypothetical protein